jgi:hypothetical protein
MRNGDMRPSRMSFSAPPDRLSLRNAAVKTTK